MLLGDVKENYYIGNIIEYYTEDGNEIVDGQQRLITIFLTLIAIYHLIEEPLIKTDIENMILVNKSCKLKLKSRIANDGSDILEYLINGSKVPIEIENRYNEIKIYKVIYKYLTEINVEKLYENIKSSNMVEITFMKSEYSAHEMFVNVNTKGKPLDMIEILKSQLFKYLLDSITSDIYKEKWETMLKNIPANEYDSFCSDCYLLDYFKLNAGADKFKTNGVVNENCLKLIDSITSKERAEKIFDFMTGREPQNVYEVYKAIKNHNLALLKDNYYSSSASNLSFGEFDELWNLYGEFGFKQSDILFITVFYNNEKLIINNSTFINLCMKYIFMYELYRSLVQSSPASYSNIFKQAAARLINGDSIKDCKTVLKNFIQNLNITQSQYESFRENLIKNDTFNSSKQKTGKYIIMMAEELYTPNLSVEHFIPQKSKNDEDKEYIGCLGNLIPVIKDRYKDNNVKNKLILYEEDRAGDKGINNFLKYNFDEENYTDKIEKRSKELAEKFIDKMKNYYERIMRG